MLMGLPPLTAPNKSERMLVIKRRQGCRWQVIDSYARLLCKQAGARLLDAVPLQPLRSKQHRVCARAWLCVCLCGTDCRQTQKQSALLERRVGDDQRNAFSARDPTRCASLCVCMCAVNWWICLCGVCVIFCCSCLQSVYLFVMLCLFF